MSALTSLLVRDKIVSVKTVEKAIQHQVMVGGDMDTVLLEIGSVSEHVMGAYLAALSGDLPATRDEVMKVRREVVRRMPRDLCVTHRVVPIQLEEDALVVASATPLASEAHAELSALGFTEVSVRIVPRVRIEAGLAHHFGIEIEPRLTRLADKLRHIDPGKVPYVKPVVTLESERRTLPPPAKTTTPAPSRPPVDSPDVNVAAVVGVSSRPPGASSSRPPGASSSRPPGAPSSRPPRHDTIPAAASAVEISPEPSRPRGPALSPNEARARLGNVAHRDDIAAALFDCGRSFFDYCALFVVHGDIAEGHDAFGTGARAEAVRRMAIPLDVPGTFADVRRTGAPRIVDLTTSELDALVAHDLERTDAQPSILLPFRVRDRAVFLLYGDRDGDPVGFPEVAELLVLAPAVSAAAEQLILRQKAASNKIDTTPVIGSDAQSPLEVSSPVRSEPPSPSPDRGAAEARIRSRPSVPYSLKPGTVDTVSGKSVERPARRRGRGPDPRREDEIESYVHDVVANIPESPLSVPEPGEGRSDPGRPTVPGPDDPTIIVDMGPNVEATVEDFVSLGPEEVNAAVPSLLVLGEAALPVLIREFPGNLWFDRAQPHTKLPRGRDVCSAGRGLVAFGEQAVPYLAALFDSPWSDVRFYSMLVATEFHRPELIAPLGRRVFDDDVQVRELAIEALRPLSRHWLPFEEMLEGIRAAASIPREDLPLRQWSARVLGYLRDAASVRLLTRLLDEATPELREAARESLVLLTRQDFGVAREAWEAWVDKHAGRHRLEWLIDALVSDREDLRTAAADELKQITHAYFGYHPRLPKRDRSVCQRKYLDWWEREGRLAHARQTLTH